MLLLKLKEGIELTLSRSVTRQINLRLNGRYPLSLNGLIIIVHHGALLSIFNLTKASLGHITLIDRLIRIIALILVLQRQN